MNGVSQPRNSIIADVFYRLELIESYGTGIKKIFESYSESVRKPEIQPAPASFVITLPKLTAHRKRCMRVKEGFLLFLPPAAQPNHCPDVKQFLLSVGSPSGIA